MDKINIALGKSSDNEDEVNGKVRELFYLTLLLILSELGRDISKWKYESIIDITSRVDIHISDLHSKLIKLSSDMEQSAIVSGMSIGGALLPPSAPFTMNTLDPIMLKALGEYRADLIRGVTDDMRNRITSIIRRAIITGRSPSDTAAEIGATIDSGTFKNSTARASKIVRQEFARIAAMANQMKMDETGNLMPNLRKMWITAMVNSREAHIMAHGQVVPYNQPYIVGGESLMYPLDPMGSAKNVINCHCVSIPMVV